ncbi:MAG TPA: hypothetical protein VFV34_17510, partial [Blastocatellia bacterium]|nr:hypothetical protein [Blastocatellia bacterium]
MFGIKHLDATSAAPKRLVGYALLRWRPWGYPYTNAKPAVRKEFWGNTRAGCGFLPRIRGNRFLYEQYRDRTSYVTWEFRLGTCFRGTVRTGFTLVNAQVH